MKPPLKGSQRRGESGQAAVETAIVMPMFVFLLLGILQLGLIAQARVMAKYAAYRAAPVGALPHADRKAMDSAATLYLLPVLAGARDVIRPTGSVQQVTSKFTRQRLDNVTAVPGGSMVRVAICGPTEDELRGTGKIPLPRADQKSRYGLGSRDEVDFDDPTIFEGAEDPASGPGIRKFNQLRLRVQVQLLYRMPIPFANWIINRIYLGSSLPSVLMMGSEGQDPEAGDEKDPFIQQFNAVKRAAANGAYLLPINVSYAMRMHSNFVLRQHPLPQNNECLHYAP